jgi:hypothetical protein
VREKEPMIPSLNIGYDHIQARIKTILGEVEKLSATPLRQGHACC